MPGQEPAMLAQLKGAISSRHGHENKTVLDKFKVNPATDKLEFDNTPVVTLEDVAAKAVEAAIVFGG